MAAKKAGVLNFCDTKKEGVQRVDRESIRIKSYLSATSSVSRSLTRLYERGLMRQGLWYKHELTDAGWRLILDRHKNG